jgi:hypothetical protein
MRLSANPDLGAPRRLLLTAAGVTLVAAAVLARQRGHIGASLGDTDDAMRMVLVRALLSGQGWFDQLVARLQPPEGAYLHWSRFIDGGLASLIWLGRRLTTADRAELVVRFAWPLVWIFPAVLAGLAIAKTLGERAAVMATGILMVLTMRLFIQFTPGRVDHHNVQIVLVLASLAMALRASRRPRWAALSGVASGLGLAIGLEALIFHALVGASFALRLAQDRDEAKAVRAYGLALAAATVVFFAIETAPWRWSMSFCDEIGLNLVGAVAFAGTGMALVSTVGQRLSALARTTVIGLVGLTATAIYLGLDPSCIHGPFAALDPRVRPFWFDRIQEIQGWRTTISSDRDGALRQIVMGALCLAAGSYLWIRGRKTDPGAILVLLSILAATLATASARRMEAYLFWIGLPVLGAALSVAARRRLSDLLLPTLAVTLLLSPGAVAGAATAAADLVLGRPRPGPLSATGRCFATRAYAHLAMLPAGLVVSETDLGPFILASTQDSALAAPYHRMSIGIMAAHNVLAASPQRAELLALAAHSTYVVDCPPYPMMVGAGSLGEALRQGKTPAWLQRLTAPSEVLQIYRVRPAGAL